MKNNKGFVMTETLVVTVFLVTIFTFIYISISPLLGKYEDLIRRENDIDIVYKLYHIRKMFLSDPNRHTSLMNEPYKKIENCNSFTDVTYCNTLMNYLDLNNWMLIYVDDIYDHFNDLEADNKGVYDYIYKFQDDVYKYADLKREVLILLDKDKETIAYLLFDDIS